MPSHDTVRRASTLHESLIELVGGTPLVRLRRLADDAHARVYVKLEYFNPGGSVKDRAAAGMVAAAEASGELGPGGTVVEGTSGNTGVGLAQVAAIRGYRAVAVLPDNVAREKIDTLTAYGAEVVLTRAGLPLEHPDHVRNLARRIAAQTSGGWFADQYDNPANPRAHLEMTGPEIWRDTGGAVTHFVGSIGTGGTISGTGRYLKEVSGGRVQVIGVDPLTSGYHGGDGSPFYTEAAGHYRHPDTVTDVWPRCFDTDVPDRIREVSDRDSILTARALATHEGILVGGSSGLAAAGALQVARELGPQALVVALLPDSGHNYLSKYHSPAWLHRFGFLDDDRPDVLAGAGVVGAVHTVTARDTVGAAAAVLRGQARRQPALPVVLPGRDPRFATAVVEILGLLDPAEVHAAADRDGPDAALPACAPPVAVGAGETAAEALARVDEAGARHAVVIRDGRLAGLVTRADLVRLLH
ncbi:MAG TPA: pyridoxal-phosphate dependent enzyme [Pseudonocardia sp.]|jgi:cystathionine beta-synthase